MNDSSLIIFIIVDLKCGPLSEAIPSLLSNAVIYFEKTSTVASLLRLLRGINQTYEVRSSFNSSFIFSQNYRFLPCTGSSCAPLCLGVKSEALEAPDWYSLTCSGYDTVDGTLDEVIDIFHHVSPTELDTNNILRGSLPPMSSISTLYFNQDSECDVVLVVRYPYPTTAFPYPFVSVIISAGGLLIPARFSSCSFQDLHFQRLSELWNETGYDTSTRRPVYSVSARLSCQKVSKYILAVFCVLYRDLETGPVDRLRMYLCKHVSWRVRS